ncbi:hypothetical protein DL766_002728 [Monosporascus sp. MC13-8B]|nr:hypothetical protein DL766_002728 [Monosporascus sp. MC13-8B]
MTSPPWAAASSHEQYFVLLTGANSGVGLGIGQRLIDDFLATRSLTSHLILIPTTRSLKKSRETIQSLRAHVEHAARHSGRLRSRAGPDYNPQAAVDRVHFLSLQLDLCDLQSVYAAADRLVRGELSDPAGHIKDASIPRIDAAIFNAGIGGWSGLNWPGLARQFMSVGLVQAATFPSFKEALPAAVLDRKKLLGDRSAEAKSPPPELAEVFCANVFGHYVLAHELMPLLSRRSGGELPPGRVIWTSSIDAGEEHLDLDDFQARVRKPPYESSKRVTDIIALTAELPGVQPIAAPYFSAASAPPSSAETRVTDEKSATQTVRPRFYVSHPGIVCTPLFPLNWFLFFWYHIVMYVARWLGSPWHTVEPYEGACAPAWLALADQGELDALNASRSKWGSACSRSGRVVAPKKTEGEGGGGEGQVGGPEEAVADPRVARDPGLNALLSNAKGRKWDAVALTEEKAARFEEDGRRCWAELERLRREWEAALGRR